jgi:hypothetical protein
MPRGSTLSRLERFDSVIVERLVSERFENPPNVTAADRWEAVRRLARMKLTDGQIAHRIGCTRRTALRIRTALGLPAVLPARGANQYDRVHDAPCVGHRAA